MEKVSMLSPKRGTFHARTVAALLLAFLVLFAWGPAASAEISSQVVAAPSRDTEHRRVTTFAGEMPEAIQQALSQNGFSGYACYSGVMLEELATQRYQGEVDDLGAQALVALEKDGARILVGMARVGRDWNLSNLGEKALLPGREFTIGASDEDNASPWYVPFRFTVTYPQADGGSEIYGLYPGRGGPDLAPGEGIRYRLWYVTDYQQTDGEGKGIAIQGGDGAFRTVSLPYDEAEEPGYYTAYVLCALDYMEDIADFPTSAQEAKRLAEVSLMRFEGTDLAMAWGGVNLRKYPTTASTSFGRVRTGALVHVLGEEKGWDAPWYHVRLGTLEGFISGVYLRFPDAADFSMALSAGPLAVARTLDACVLRESPADGAGGAEIPAGTLVHVLADADDEWLYVMAPRGEIGWEMDVEGTGGYVKASEVEQGVYIDGAAE